MGPIWVLSAPDGPHVGPAIFCYQGWFRGFGIWRRVKWFPSITDHCMCVWHVSRVPFWRQAGCTWGSGHDMKTDFPGIVILIIKIRCSWDRLIFIVRTPTLVKWHLHIETAPWLLEQLPYSYLHSAGFFKLYFLIEYLAFIFYMCQRCFVGMRPVQYKCDPKTLLLIYIVLQKKRTSWSNYRVGFNDPPLNHIIIWNIFPILIHE